MKIIVTTENDFNPSQASIVKEYEIVNDGSPRAIRRDYQEARKVWAEYYVIADCGRLLMSDSHTYADECKMQLK